METAEQNKEMVVKKPKKKALKIILIALVVLLLVLILAVAFVVPAYVSSDSCRQMILAKANAAGAGTIDFADLSMSWGKGLSISGLSFKDSAESMSVAVKGFSTRPHYGALLTGNLSLGETVIDEPRIEINVEKMKQKPAAQPGAPAKPEVKAGLPVQRMDLVVKDGDVKIKGGAGAVEVSQINSTVNLRPEGERTEFEVGANIADGGAVSTINAKGGVKPGKNWDLKKTSGDVTIEVNNLDLGSLESILAVAGVEMEAKGTVSANISGSLKDGVIEKVSGAVSGKGLEITAPQLKGDKIKTSVLDIAVEMAQQGDLVNVEKLTVQTDWLKAQASGIAPMSAGSMTDFMKPDSKYELNANLECDLPAVAAQLPGTLGLKEGTTITTGKLLGSVQTLSEAGQKKLSGQVSIDGLRGTVEGKPISISEPIRAEVVIAAEGKQVKFEKAQVTSAFAKVNCEGTMEAFNYDAQVDLARLASELGQFADLGKYRLAGQVTSSGQVNSDTKAKKIAVAGSANINNLRISPTPDITISEPSAAVEIMTVIDNAAQTLLIKQLKADTSFGKFSVKDGKLPMAKGAKEPMSLTASAAGMDLAKLQPYLVMSKAISKDIQLGGIADSDVTVGFAGDSFKLKTESTKIANLMIKAPGKEPFMQNPVELALDAEVNPATKNWTIKADITSPNIKIKGNFQQKTENQTSDLQGNAQLDYDWKTLSGMLSAFMPSALVIEGKRKDTVSFNSRYPASDPNAMMANLNAQTKVGFDSAGYMGLNLGATNVDIKVDKGFLTILPFTTTVNNGQFNFGGSADFKKKPAMFRTPGPMHIIKDVQINDIVANQLLNRVNPIFTGASGVSGLANFDCNQMIVPITGGKPEDADIVGTISLTGVKMQSGLLGAILTAIGGSGDLMTIHPTAFTVRDGFVRYANMQMDIGNTPINFAGSMPLDANREIENLSITLPFAAKGGIVKTGEQEGSRRITAYVKGTPRRPELDIGKTVQEELIQTGLELLLEKAKKK